jgi:hypothetical protein
VDLRDSAFVDGDQMNFGVLSALGFSDSLPHTFFNAPCPCVCTLTDVESNARNSTLTATILSACNVVNSRSTTPDRAHLENLWYTEYQSPNSRGWSRQGQPVRTIHNTAFTNL